MKTIEVPIKITVPDDIADRVERVEYRPNAEGEYVINIHGDLERVGCAELYFCRLVLILKPPPNVWPSWVQPGWIAVDRRGVYWFSHEPIVVYDTWSVHTGDWSRLAPGTDIRDHLPPLSDGWRKNKWQVKKD